MIFLIILVTWIFWGAFGPGIFKIFMASPAIDSEYSEYVNSLSPKSGFETAAQWGDSFGSLNALFSGLAFLGVYTALIMQEKASRRQIDDYHRQRFESTYFELVSLLSKSRDEVRFLPTPGYRKNHQKKYPGAQIKTCRGNAAFKNAVFNMRYFIERFDKIDNTKKLTDADLISLIYRRYIHRRYESTFSPYFRIVYTILKRIKADKTLTEQEKVQYANLLRSQMTSFEISLSAFNGLTEESNDFSELLTEFHMLKYLPSGIVRRTLEKVYDEKAFLARND